MSTSNILKVSVLADGRLLLDGQPAMLSAIGQAMDLAQGNGVVWYYRENAAAEPHPVAVDVMKLITSRRLPVRLSSLPDFSDSVTPAMAALEKVFAPIRQKAAQHILVVLRPDGRHLALTAPQREAVSAEAVAAVERILPSDVPRNVAAIGDTQWTMAETPSVTGANQAIPFFGLLMGFAGIGHAVWIFDAGTSDAIAAGCRHADLLIVDSARLAALPSGWQTGAAKGMRNGKILVHDRATYHLCAVDAETLA
jgi:hypothetical protein